VLITRNRSHVAALLAALALAGLTLLASAPGAEAAPRDDRSRPLVYVLVLDGLDGDRVRQRRTLAPFLNELLDGRQGARSTLFDESRSVMIAETNPNHTAMVTGAYAGESGIPGNAFAVYGSTPDEDSCPTGPLDESQPPNETSGESPGCLEAETLFETVAKSRRAEEITTSGIFGKPKLGRLFSGRSGGRYAADDLWAPCELAGDDPPYCERVPINPATRYAAEDRIVMDEVIETVNEGVSADGTRKRPNLTFVNFPQIDSAGHATGTGGAYDTAITRADQEIQRFVSNQKRLGLWSRTTMLVVSDHSMDATSEKTSLTRCYQAAGIDSDSYIVVQNGNAALVYLTDRTDPRRFGLLRRLRQASLRCGLGGVGELGARLGLSGTNEALYRQANPADGGTAHTLGRVHPSWRLVDRRTGDLVVTHDAGGAFSDPVNPLAGNHGSPFTRDNMFAVIGGSEFVRQQTIRGVRDRRLDDTRRNPGQAENVDVAATALCALGHPAPADSSGRFVSEAFRLAILPGAGEPACEQGARGGTRGTDTDDVLIGTDGDDVIRCGSGNDRVDGRGGDDVIHCGSGNDVVRGGSGDDRLFGESGDDLLDGGPGNDRLDGGSGDDRLIGGPGRDRFSDRLGRNTRTP
jgi:hypothetical protein